MQARIDLPRFAVVTPFPNTALYKRLEKGTFAWPVAREGETVELAATELMMMLGGVDVAATRRRRWYQRSSEIISNM